MKLVCYRSGRAGFNIGDVIEVPDNVDQWDRVTFREIIENDPILNLPAPATPDAADLQAQLDAAQSSDEPSNEEAE